MDLNQKIAQRRAQLQQEQAAEDALRRQEEHQQAQQMEAERKAIEEMAAKEATSRIDAMEAQLQKVTATEPSMLPTLDPRVSEQADKKVDEHIRKLAKKRITRSERWKGRVLFMAGFLGLFIAPWLSLILWGWAFYYGFKVVERHAADIRAEIKKGEGQ